MHWQTSVIIIRRLLIKYRTLYRRISYSDDADTVVGGPKMPFCSEAWDAISRYIYTGLQGGSIMKGWMKKENEMIACCSDGTRPVISRLKELIMIRNNRTVLIEME